MQRELIITKPLHLRDSVYLSPNIDSLAHTRVLVGPYVSCVGFRRNGLKIYSGAVDHIPKSLRQKF